MLSIPIRQGKKNTLVFGREDGLLNRRSLGAGLSAALAMPNVARPADARPLQFVPYTDLLNLDPVTSSAAVSRCHGYLVFDTLYGQTAASSGAVPKPQMIQRHLVEDDGLTWRLHLRQRLVFHDGEAVLARDCVASIQRWAARDPLGQALLQRTRALVADDDRNHPVPAGAPVRALAVRAREDRRRHVRHNAGAPRPH